MKEPTIAANIPKEIINPFRRALQKKISSTAIDIISVLFIILFVYAAISKWQSISTFELQLSKSPMLVPYAHILCWTLPAFELIVASLLIFPKSRLIGFYCSYGLMVMFTTYIIAVTRFSEDIPCSCGGILQNMGWDQHLVFNVIFTFLGLLGVLLYGNYKNPKLITMKNRI